MRLLSGLVAAALLSACAPASDAPLSDDDVRALRGEVEAAVAGLTAAMNAHDGAAVVSFYSDAADFLYVACTSFIQGGRTFAETVQPYYRNNPEVTFEQNVVSTRVLADGVAVVSLVGGSSDGPPLFWTQVWERGEDGRWVIVREHESWPGCSDPPAAHPMTGLPEEVGAEGAGAEEPPPAEAPGGEG